MFYICPFRQKNDGIPEITLLSAKKKSLLFKLFTRILVERKGGD